MNTFEHFAEIVLVDFEYSTSTNLTPQPLCVVATEVRSGRTHKKWLDPSSAERPPYRTDDKTLFVSYYAPAELSCHLALGWSMPAHVLDLFAEFRNHTNGKKVPAGRGLVGALTYFGMPFMTSEEKGSMRDLAIRGGPYSEKERKLLLNYCESDVRALATLFYAMESEIDLPRALLRGRSMKAVAAMERQGIPIDMQTFGSVTANWSALKAGLVRSVDANFKVFEGERFSERRFSEFLHISGMSWPTHPSGRLLLDRDTFKERSTRYPALHPLRELREGLSEMRLNNLSVGADGRNRCMLSPFQAKTGRNQPSTSKFIFGPSTWLRGLIKPSPGYSIGYIDWSQQEFGIAAALSGDKTMQVAYHSGDPYLEFAKQAGAAPKDATKSSHREVRERFKQCILAVQYGMGSNSLAERLGITPDHARELLALHKKTYPIFWQWSQAAVDTAILFGRIHTTFGWMHFVEGDANARSLANFPMQANGAEMLRLACCFATEAGISVCAPIHDALLIEAPSEEIGEAVEITQDLMSLASTIVLNGFALRSDCKIVNYPNRYQDERGADMWQYVMEALNSL